jgi:hypothetical protein
MSKEWHGGKGDKPRKDADPKKYAENWEKIFGDKKEKEKEKIKA